MISTHIKYESFLGFLKFVATSMIFWKNSQGMSKGHDIVFFFIHSQA